MNDGPDLSWGADEADDLDQYGPPRVKPAIAGEAIGVGEPVAMGEHGMIVRVGTSGNVDGGIMVTAHLNGNAPAPRATSGANELAGHRPTRYALIMRRRQANKSRVVRGVQQLPAILPGDCATCRGLGVVNGYRQRCPLCNGSGQR